MNFLLIVALLLAVAVAQSCTTVRPMCTFVQSSGTIDRKLVCLIGTQTFQTSNLVNCTAENTPCPCAQGYSLGCNSASAWACVSVNTDPCVGITCNAPTVCKNGNCACQEAGYILDSSVSPAVCRPNCGSSTCAPGTTFGQATCNCPTSNECIDRLNNAGCTANTRPCDKICRPPTTGCTSTSCPTGTICSSTGSCVSDPNQRNCDTTTCGLNQVCVMKPISSTSSTLYPVCQCKPEFAGPNCLFYSCPTGACPVSAAGDRLSICVSAVVGTNTVDRFCNCTSPGVVPPACTATCNTNPCVNIPGSFCADNKCFCFSGLNARRDAAGNLIACDKPGSCTCNDPNQVCSSTNTCICDPNRFGGVDASGGCKPLCRTDADCGANAHCVIDTNTGVAPFCVCTAPYTGANCLTTTRPNCTLPKVVSSSGACVDPPTLTCIVIYVKFNQNVDTYTTEKMKELFANYLNSDIAYFDITIDGAVVKIKLCSYGDIDVKKIFDALDQKAKAGTTFDPNNSALTVQSVQSSGASFVTLSVLLFALIVLLF